VEIVVNEEPVLELPEFHEEHGPIDPLEDQLDEYTPKYRTLREAYEAHRKDQERKEEDD
jgi:hypothetical protein